MKLIQPWVYGFACLFALSTTSCNQQAEKKETSQSIVDEKTSSTTLSDNSKESEPIEKMLETPPPPPVYNVEASITEEEESGDLMKVDDASAYALYDKSVVSNGTVLLGEKSKKVYPSGGRYTNTISTGLMGNAVSVNKPNAYDEMSIPDMYYQMDQDKDRYKEDKTSNESYSQIIENKFINPANAPFSTFSIDVDNASYSNVRRMLASNQMPPKDAVRIEEMINYFKYDYPNPTGEDPFSINTELAPCPWNSAHQLLMVGIQGKKINYSEINPSNLVFLVDVSGSMSDAGKLPLVKQSMKLLVDNLDNKDKIAIVVYAGNAGLVLPSTSVSDKTKIKNAIDNLEAGGSTAGGAGIQLAYKTAEANFVPGGNNRIILATDGDFNVGVSGDNELKKLIETEREKKIFLTVTGYGMGNYKDSKMETIADNGNGNYYYIDNYKEAEKVFQTDMRATLFTIAKDVKLQLEFNPKKIAAYRLIGYENRVMAKEDFNNDKKDAGELGAGHTVTAMYEVIPAGASIPDISLEGKPFLKSNDETYPFKSDELLVLNLRYKKPEGDVSKLLSHSLKESQIKTMFTSDNFRFASSVALFGMLLRDSKYSNSKTYSDVLKIATASMGLDSEGYRKEFLQMVKEASLLASK